MLKKFRKTKIKESAAPLPAVEEGERIPAPPLPDDLAKVIKKGKYIIWIGAGVSRSVRSPNVTLPNYRQLIERLAENLPSKKKKAITALLEKPESTAIEEAAEAVMGALGDTKFFFLMSQILDPLDANLEVSLPYKLLRSLQPKALVTTNYDRFLENFASNGEEHTLTAPDMEALGVTVKSIEERPMILKIHGDIARPVTIPFGVTQLYGQYGYTPEGESIPEEKQSSLAKYYRAFMKDLFSTYSVIFLGSSIGANEAYVSLLKEMKAAKTKMPTHYALVMRSQSYAPRLDGDEIGIKYILYDPDSKHSQLWEFMAYLNAAKVDRPIVGGRAWEKSFLKQQRNQYLKAQLDMEKRASAVYFFTPSLTNSITTDAHLENFSKPGLLKAYSKETTEKVMKLMFGRKNNLESRLLARGDDFIVRAMFLENNLTKDFSTEQSREKQEYNVKRYEHLMMLLEGSAGKLQVRMVPHLTNEQLRGDYEASYALIHAPGVLDKNDASQKFVRSDVGMAFASQATVNFFQILLFHINTPEVEVRVGQFERCWSAARSSQESMELIRNKLTEAKAALETN